MDQPVSVRLFVVVFDIGKIFIARSPAVISHTPQHGNAAFRLFLRPFQNRLQRFPEQRVIPVRRTHHGDRTAVRTFPRKTGMRERKFARVRSAYDIPLLPAFTDDLHEPAGMPERVHVERDFGKHAEFFGKIFFPVQDLPNHAFSARHIAIGLQKPPADDFPPALFHAASDFFEKLGRISFHIAVSRHFVVTENIIVRFKQSEGGSKSRYRRTRTFLPVPLPYRIDMRVTNQMYFFHPFSSFTIVMPILFPTEYAATILSSVRVTGGISG